MQKPRLALSLKKWIVLIFDDYEITYSIVFLYQPLTSKFIVNN